MLNRRILRIKAFKELFAIEMSPAPSLKEALAQLDAAAESTRDLYIFMMGSIVALTAVSRERLAILDKKINKTPEEKNPNRKFADNSLAAILEKDPDFDKIFSARFTKKGICWGAYDLILKKIFASIQTKDYFTEYMSTPQTSLALDCKLFTKIFEEEFTEREDLATALEDINIYWNDDLPYSLSWCCRSLETMAKGTPWKLPDLYISTSNSSMEDDQKFVHKLLREAYANYDKYFEAVSSIVPNWDEDRLVGTDIALIITALAEIVHFPTIPVNVSINEYVEISKYFGTPKSSQFVNGLLDALSKKDEFKKQIQ